MRETRSNHCSHLGKTEGANTIISEVTDYWASLRTGSQPPMRQQIDPAALGHKLPHIFLAELVSPRVAKLRICGQQIEDMLGMEMRGMPVTAMFSGTARNEVMQAIEHVSLGARVTLVLEGESGFGLPHLTATLALLPLTDASGKISRVMGVLMREGDPGRTPRYFTLARTVDLTAEPAPFATAPRPALRVIKGGKL